MCTNNTNNNCGCENNECGCKTSIKEVVYVGPPLSCLGITNCTNMEEILQTINNLVCSPELVQILINNIINNPIFLNQFTQIVNNSINCETVWNCESQFTTTTSTTVAPSLVYKLAGDVGSQNACCLLSPGTPVTLYPKITSGNLFNVDDIMYLDVEQTIPFSGDYQYFKLQQNGIIYCCIVGDDGKIFSKYNCL